MIQVTPVILCGGSGTRLWPLSRTGFPKQFLCLTGDESLFQQAAKRLATLALEQLLYWGHSKDYVRMQWMMLQQDQPEDSVIATGVEYSVQQFIEWSAGELGIKLRFEGQEVDEVAIINSIEGDIPALNFRVGSTLEITASQMCTEMVANDFEQTKQHALLKANGYPVNVRVK